MKIIKYKKISVGKYEITLDDNSKIKVYEDIILKENLLWKKEIDDIDVLLSKNQEYEIFHVAYKYISHHVTSKRGMQKFLELKGYSVESIKKVINEIENKGLLDDDYYAKCYINNQINLSLDGPNKIIKHLEDENISSECYMKYLDLDSFIWKERIDKYLEKQLRINKNSIYYFRNKMINNLLCLGYNREMIEASLNKVHVDNEEELKQKEEKKLRIKLSRKYQGDELERKIREKLRSKGFFE